MLHCDPNPSCPGYMRPETPNSDHSRGGARGLHDLRSRQPLRPLQNRYERPLHRLRCLYRNYCQRVSMISAISFLPEKRLMSPGDPLFTDPPGEFPPTPV